MSTSTQATSITTSITVKAPVERAFSVFTEDVASWWPKEHHLLGVELKAMVLEPRAGGSFYDVGVDGSECHFARVLVFDPPHQLVFSWDVSLEWQLETDLAKTSEVAVTFRDQGDGTTLVELEHRHLDRHGDGFESLRDEVGSDGGWPGTLRSFAARVAS